MSPAYVRLETRLEREMFKASVNRRFHPRAPNTNKIGERAKRHDNLL